MLRGYEAATLLCPSAVTGGPQALHQLAHALNTFGLPTEIAYYRAGGRIVRKGGRFICIAPERNVCLTAYEKYNPVPSAGWSFNEKHLIVLPEVMITQYRSFSPNPVAIWWLAVDNAFRSSNQFSDKEFRKSIFSDASLHHFHPTAYARAFLRTQGIERTTMLSDYTDDQFTTVASRGPNPDRTVAHNPRKGSKLADAFFARNPDLDRRPIEGLSRREVWEAFRKTQVYVDFSHFPGRECMPREAAVSGAVIFVHHMGAARFYEDYPLPNFYRFTSAHVESGELRRKIDAVFANPLRFWKDQESFRRSTAWEKNVFFDQVARSLGLRR